MLSLLLRLFHLAPAPPTAVDFQIAGRNLAQHTKRTLFLGSALAAITALMVLLNGLTNGAQQVLIDSGSTLFTGHVNVAGFYKPSAGMSAPMVLDYEKVLQALEGEVPGLDYHVERDRGYAKAVSDTGSLDIVLGGIDITREPGLKKVVQPVEGNLDELAKPNTLLIFQAQQKKLGVKVGDMITLSAPTARGMNNTLDVRIAAIGKDMGLLSAMSGYMPSDSLHRLYQSKPNSTGAIQLYLKDYLQAKPVAAKLRTLLESKGWRVMDPDPQPYYMKLLAKVNREDWTGQKLDVTTWEDELSMMSWSVMGMRFLTSLLLLVLLIIVLAGIMSTMWIAVRERTREIGTLRAIGMRRGKVGTLFVLEATLLGLGSTCAGALLGTLVALGLNAARVPVPESVQLFLLADHLHLAIQGGSVAGSIILITVLTAIASLFPSIRAARLQPVTAMHHAG